MLSLVQRVKNLVAGGQLLLRRAAPAFRQEIIEQVRVLARHPEQPARAFGPAKNVIHPQHIRGAQMRRQRLGRVRVEPAGHVLEIKLPVDASHGLFVLGGAFEQFVVHQRISKLVVVIAQQQPFRLRAQNDVRRFHVHDPVAFLPQFMRDQAGDAGEKFRLHLAFKPELLRRLDRVQPLDPAEQHDVLPQNINLHAGMTRHLRADFVLGTPRLPELQPVARHVDRQRALGADADGRRAGLTPAQFHQQRKFLKRTVEFRLNELINREGVERHHFAHARPFDNQVQHLAIHRSRRHLIDHARALQPLTIGLKPFARVPVFRQQALPERQTETRKIKIAAVVGLQMEIIHAQQ